MPITINSMTEGLHQKHGGGLRLGATALQPHVAAEWAGAGDRGSLDAAGLRDAGHCGWAGDAAVLSSISGSAFWVSGM